MRHKGADFFDFRQSSEKCGFLSSQNCWEEDLCKASISPFFGQITAIPSRDLLWCHFIIKWLIQSVEREQTGRVERETEERESWTEEQLTYWDAGDLTTRLSLDIKTHQYLISMSAHHYANFEYLILDLNLICAWDKNWLSFSSSEGCPF